MSDLLTLERGERGVYTLTIRRPDVRNALNEEAFHELIAACEQVGADDAARVLVLTGEGRAFSAGGDFDSLQRMLDGDRAHAGAAPENAGAGVVARHTISTATRLGAVGSSVSMSTVSRCGVKMTGCLPRT